MLAIRIQVNVKRNLIIAAEEDSWIKSLASYYATHLHHSKTIPQEMQSIFTREDLRHHGIG